MISLYHKDWPQSRWHLLPSQFVPGSHTPMIEVESTCRSTIQPWRPQCLWWWWTWWWRTLSAGFYLPSVPLHPRARFWRRYSNVYNTCIAPLWNFVKPFHAHLNSNNPNIQFTAQSYSEGHYHFEMQPWLGKRMAPSIHRYSEKLLSQTSTSPTNSTIQQPIRRQ